LRPQGREDEEMRMPSIAVTSVFADHQEKALTFCTQVLGFTNKRDLPVDDERWPTVVPPAAPAGVEPLLEPNTNPISGTYQKATHEAGVPAASFPADDIEEEYRRMTGRGVVLTAPPARSGDVTGVVFDDTCGTPIGLFQG
jgi:predicted enzyme related to lactoylglutathione lyase